MKQKLSEERILNITKDGQLIVALANCIHLLHSMELVDSKFRVPTVNQMASRIKSDAEGIIKHCFTIIRPIESIDYIAYDHAYEMLRLVRWFSSMHTPQLREYMDLVEKVPTVDIKETINHI